MTEEPSFDHSDAHNALAHWLLVSSYLFVGPIRQVLLTGTDPITEHDPERDRAAGQRLLQRWRESTLLERPNGLMPLQRVRRLQLAVDSLRVHQYRAYVAIAGSVIDEYIDLVIHGENQRKSSGRAITEPNSREQQRALDTQNKLNDG